MMDAVNDTSVETVVIMSSAQVGKTELLNNVVGFYVDHEPCPILLLQPTLEMAQTWSKDRLAPMLRDTPALKGRIKDAKSRNSGNTMLHKTFEGGHITMAGANSPASLASRPIRIVLADEVDRYPVSAGTEGDPVSLARKRTNTFWNKKIILTSTPTIKGASRIDTEFQLSDKRFFNVPCPHCDQLQKLTWANVIFDKENIKDTYYACVNGCVIDEAEKIGMLLKGEWIAEGEFNGRAGFHISELYSPWRKWREVVKDFLEMKDNPETLKTWTNTALGEVWEEKGDEVDHEKLLNRVESYDSDSLPDDILLITAGVDVQKDRLEALSYGWGEEFEQWVIEHKIFWGDTAARDVWRELDEWLLKPYQCGQHQLKIACTLVDSGFNTDHVYNFCKPRQGRRVFAIKGSSNYYAPVASKPVQAGRQRVQLYSIGTDTAKDTILLSWLNNDDYGQGYIHFPHTCDEEYFKQLTAEFRKSEFTKGVKRFKWVSKRERNEICDLHVYNYGAYAVLEPDIGAISQRRQPKEQPVIEQASTIRRPKPVRKRRNWATDI